MEKSAKIYIAGHRGMVGSAIHRTLQGRGYSNFVLKTHGELDLTNQRAVEEFFLQERRWAGLQRTWATQWDFCLRICRYSAM